MTELAGTTAGVGDGDGPSLAATATRDRTVIAGCAVAGFATVALILGTSLPANDFSDRYWRWTWTVPQMLLPLISLVGGRLAPTRGRAVVIATVATWFLLVLVSKLMSMTIEVLTWQAVLLLLCAGGATIGRLWARRSADGRRTAAPVE